MSQLLGCAYLLASFLAAGTDVVIDGLKSPAPEAWKEVPTSSPMRYKQFTVPRVGADTLDGEVIVFYFGPGQGGDAPQNIDRWKKMFEPPKGKTIDQVSKVSTPKTASPAVKLTVLEVNGTYLYKPVPMAPQSEPRPNHRMLAAVLETPKGPYFVRLVGPEKTITKNKKPFETWLKSFK